VKLLELELPISDNKVNQDIAVLSMAGRFPGAKDLHGYWHNLRAGVESIHFDATEALNEIVHPRFLGEQPLVKGRGILKSMDWLDAGLFDLNARASEPIDPQQRILLECAWEALEAAGYNTNCYGGRFGIFAVSSNDMYFQHIVRIHPGVRNFSNCDPLNTDQKDSLTSGVSQKLDLRGLTGSVGTPCSMSLVTVHLACQGLLNHQCDLALAGAVSLAQNAPLDPFRSTDGMVSKDGHFPALDATATGSVPRESVGLILLKRLSDARIQGDLIRAVIRGSAVNCDEGQRLGCNSQSLEAQAEVVALAQAAAGINPETIGYVEVDGPSTLAADAIEVAALTRAFGAGTKKRQFCALGSVKANIGDCGAAAGIAGLIKTILAMEHKELLPSLYYGKNSQIEFGATPFYVNAGLRPWRCDDRRRAGVSSFGIGGTNAHVVLEEYCEKSESGSSRPWHLLLLSARTASSLEKVSHSLAQHLRAHSNCSLADVAYTMQTGRRRFGQRRVVVCNGISDATELLLSNCEKSISNDVTCNAPGIVFLIPGLGDHYVGMGRDLYVNENTFRTELDYCSEQIRALIGVDIRQILYPQEKKTSGPNAPMKPIDLVQMARKTPASSLIDRTYVSHPITFVVGYALGRMWMKWGIRPRAMLGHSIGEYVAACLSGVMDINDALRIVVERSGLIASLPTGGMLTVLLGAQVVRPLLGRGLWLASENGPGQCVVAGEMEALTRLELQLLEQNVASRYTRATHAFHSGMMSRAASGLEKIMRGVKLQPPLIPYISNVTGKWITHRDVENPQYWSRHLCQEVKFGDSAMILRGRNEQFYLEVGPGQTLGGLLRQCGSGDDPIIFSSMRYSYERHDDEFHLMRTVGQLWSNGLELDWQKFYDGERRCKVALPTYQMERTRSRLEPRESKTNELTDPLFDDVVRQTPKHSVENRLPLQVGSAVHGDLDTAIEDTIIMIWQKLLGARDIALGDNFFELGGNSLLGGQLILRLRESIHVEIPLRILFEQPTVKGLALAARDFLKQQTGPQYKDDLAAET
jgi:acyl transferase domain-containing protein